MACPYNLLGLQSAFPSFRAGTVCKANACLAADLGTHSVVSRSNGPADCPWPIPPGLPVAGNCTRYPAPTLAAAPELVRPVGSWCGELLLRFRVGGLETAKASPS